VIEERPTIALAALPLLVAKSLPLTVTALPKSPELVPVTALAVLVVNDVVPDVARSKVEPKDLLAFTPKAPRDSARLPPVPALALI